jgi:hypothetical protein
MWLGENVVCGLLDVNHSFGDWRWKDLTERVGIWVVCNSRIGDYKLEGQEVCVSCYGRLLLAFVNRNIVFLIKKLSSS